MSDKFFTDTNILHADHRSPHISMFSNRRGERSLV
jgi:hypothetical protein